MNAALAIFVLHLCAFSAHGVWVKEMENKGAFEGDILLDPDEREKGWNVSRYASIKGGRWPGGVVPYVIQNSILTNGRRAIFAAIANYHKHTCIKWKYRTNERTYVSFYRGGGCSSPVGYRYGRVNTISLAAGCWHTGVTMHEMGHTLGFYHEQSRPDRDSNVRILWNNITPGMAYNFNKQSSRTVDSLGTPYDFGSMMHYGSTAFGIYGRMTIQTIDPRNQRKIGNREGFSSTDIRQLNLMYRCSTVVQTIAPPIFTAETSGPGQTSVPPPPSCVNKYGYCTKWAKLGWCHGQYMKFMILNCCKACSDLSKVKSTYAPRTERPKECIDEDANCPAWAARGECEKNPDWMKVHCRKSCHTC